MSSQILYVTDPLCLWCYGMAPDLEAFYATLPSDIHCETINGGLFPAKNARVADKSFRNYLKGAAQQVTEYTGQIFGDSFWSLLETPNFRYDTEPSARASVAIKHLLNEASMRSFIHDLQRAVFIEGKNPNDTEVLADIAVQQGADREGFVTLFNDSKNTIETHKEYMQAKQIGVTGFPAVIYIANNKGYSLAAGYSRKDMLINNLLWARKEAGQTPIDINKDLFRKNSATLSCDSNGCSV